MQSVTIAEDTLAVLSECTVGTTASNPAGAIVYATIRDLIAANPGSSLEHLPAGSFKESGTSVSTAIVVINKPVDK